MEALKNAELAAGEAGDIAQQMQASAARAQAVKSELEDQLTRASEVAATELGKLEAAVASVSESVSKATADAAVAASKREETDRLTAQAQEAYKALSSFQATLQTTQKSVADIEARALDVTAQFENQRVNVGELLLQAERMVSGSTVAGLAKAFDDERKVLDKSMNGAFWGFMFGISLLFITSGALAAYILNVPIDGWEWLTKRGTADPTLAQVLSRSVIVIAPFWLTLFSARRYRSLFDLRQQYSHKYNMAFSMDGFKTQAPSFAESIAAWVFTIVAANPVLPRAGHAMDTAPPLTVQGMMNDARNAYDKVMGKE
ncbi:hypothetical protein ASE17_15205 [Phenylobacterium sp. Root77]|nr:hypothetical protein ASC73_13175 [Phenylobacterium sp. Root1277]KQW95849.1 hypothetical protein ASC79_09265 [Phenylobacterium sp. Root1290]KRC41634.1 hypothetical protein ASE17_15205 [Phenylobacterium sp. Root77]